MTAMVRQMRGCGDAAELTDMHEKKAVSSAMHTSLLWAEVSFFVLTFSGLSAGLGMPGAKAKGRS